MEIDRIPVWIERRIRVFLDLVEAEGFGEVAASCERAGRAGFEAFLHAHLVEVYDMTSTASGPHEPILRGLPPAERHLMLLAVLYRLRQALCVGKALSDRAADMALDVHPGSLTNRAAEAGDLIVAGWPDYWPLEGWPDPFAES